MIKLGDTTFEVPAPSGIRSFALQQRIIPVAGRLVNVFLTLLGAEGEALDLSSMLNSNVLQVLPAALPALGQVFSEMPEGELEKLTRALLADTKWGTGKNMLPLFGAQGGDAFDSVMRGRTMDVWKLLWHALEVWYPDFFGLVGGFIVRSAKAANPSEASSTLSTSGPGVA